MKAKKSSKKVVRKAGGKGRITDTEKVLRVIKKDKWGATTREIKIATKFDPKKIWQIIGRLKKRGKVKSVQPGFYK